jgi:proline racemase
MPENGKAERITVRNCHPLRVNGRALNVRASARSPIDTAFGGDSFNRG